MVEGLEENLELLCLTGVEDQLQVYIHHMTFESSHMTVCLSLIGPLQLDVRPTLELLRNAGIKVVLFSPLLTVVQSSEQVVFSYVGVDADW